MQSHIYTIGVTRLRIDDALPLAAAAARLGARRARATARRTKIAPLLTPGSTVEAGTAAVVIADRAAATSTAQGLGLTGEEADRAWSEGVLAAIRVFGAEGGPVPLLCRIDHGTATAELHLGGRGAASNCSDAASAVAAVGGMLLERVPGLRRVGVTVPDGHSWVAALIDEGFVDEGWAPPVDGTGGSRMVTLLRR